nr:MAG TPA: hypothetical protein [Caudoviricetes sp.]
MTDTIIRTSGDYTLGLNGRAAVVTARTYHLARAGRDADVSASLTLLPGKWVAAATQSDPGELPGDALRGLARHVANLHGPLRVAGGDHVPGILEGLVLTANDGDVTYGPTEVRDRDIAHHRIR